MTIILIVLAGGAGAQISLAPLNDDFGVLMKSVGEDIAPQLLQAALGGDIVGEAAFKGNGLLGNISFFAMGADIGNGIGTVLGSSTQNWKFTLPMPSLISQALSSQSLYDASRNVFPYPILAMGIGFSPVRDYEVLVNGFYLPQAVLDAGVGLVPTAKKLKPVLNAGSVVVKVRKVFFKDQGGFPAMSVALGGAYSSFSMGATINSLTDFGSKVDIGGGSLLDLSGKFGVDAKVYGAGLEFHISKRLPLITPFAKLGLWYRDAVVTSDTNLMATLTPTVGAPTTQAIVATPRAENEAIAAIATTGFEIRLFAVVIHLSASLDLDSPLVEIRKLSMTGVSANGFSMRMGLRLAL
jgi:hypothetical protein